MARAFGAHGGGEGAGGGRAHHQLLPLQNGSLASRFSEKTTFEKP